MSEHLPGWTTDSIAGHTADLYTPPNLNAQGFAVVYLHGVRLGRLVANAAYTAEFARHGLPVVAPHTARSWWTDRVCEEFDPKLTAERHLLDNVVPFAEARWGAHAPRLALLGTSMGGQGALRVAFKHPRRFPVVAAVAPAIDHYRYFYEEEEETLPAMYEDAEAARQDSATLHVHPLNWPRNTWFCSDPADARWHDSAERLRMKLSALGIMHDCDLTTTAGGHSWTYYDHMAPKAVGFVIERLNRERLRAE